MAGGRGHKSGLPGSASRSEASRIRVLIADDHALLRSTLRLVLASQASLEVVGEAVDGRDAVDAAMRLLPDVVLMDIAMPKLDGIEATRRIVKRAPGTRVLLLSAFVHEDRVVDAIRAGASGYMVKSADLDELTLAIESVHRGDRYFSASLSHAEPDDSGDR